MKNDRVCDDIAAELLLNLNLLTSRKIRLEYEEVKHMPWNEKRLPVVCPDLNPAQQAYAYASVGIAFRAHHDDINLRQIGVLQQ
ncbi:hypothetical protein [Azohydromonas australica]|uniref:hypothetical protein n=1 Tax=Azohydromonas australica TaxID=364039 RepID=UPI0012EC9246|nr:hypothetical protein [Azohydromonas australica]